MHLCFISSAELYLYHFNCYSVINLDCGVEGVKARINIGNRLGCWNAFVVIVVLFVCVRLQQIVQWKVPRAHRAAEGGERACNTYRRHSAECY